MHYLLANGENMYVREAIPKDASALLTLFQKVVRETGFLKTLPKEADRITEEQERKYIEHYTQKNHCLLLVAETEKAIIGSLTLTQKEKAKQHHIADLGIIVLADYWNMGIARRLLNRMMNWIEHQDMIQYLQLEIQANNEKAIRIGREFGFLEEGRSTRAICIHSGMYEDLVFMGKWLGKHPLE